MNAQETTLRKELMQAVSEGMNAEDCGKFFFKVIHNRRTSIHDSLERSSILDNQKFDNSALIMAHLELKMLRELEDTFNDVISRGQESSAKLREMDETEQVISSPLKF